MSSVRLALQIAGRGRLEGHPPGDIDGVRFEGRFRDLQHDRGQGLRLRRRRLAVDAQAGAQYGRGPQSANFVAVRSGYCLEGFVTDGDGLVGHTIGRASAHSRLRIYFDRSPDGSRDFEDRASFMKGELVAT